MIHVYLPTFPIKINHSCIGKYPSHMDPIWVRFPIKLFTSSTSRKHQPWNLKAPKVELPFGSWRSMRLQKEKDKNTWWISLGFISPLFQSNYSYITPSQKGHHRRIATWYPTTSFKSMEMVKQQTISYVKIWFIIIQLKQAFLVGDFKDLWDFHPDPWSNDPIWRAYFWDGLKPTRTSHPKKALEDVFCFVLEICPTEYQKNQPENQRPGIRRAIQNSEWNGLPLIMAEAKWGLPWMALKDGFHWGHFTPKSVELFHPIYNWWLWGSQDAPVLGVPEFQLLKFTGPCFLFRLWHAFSTKMYLRYVLLLVNLIFLGPWSTQIPLTKMGVCYFFKYRERNMFEWCDRYISSPYIGEGDPTFGVWRIPSIFEFIWNITHVF